MSFANEQTTLISVLAKKQLPVDGRHTFLKWAKINW